jgi:signal transduction histidine kinase
MQQRLTVLIIQKIAELLRVVAGKVNGDTGDVEAVTYAVDIDEQKNTEIMVHTLTRDIYNFLILLDMNSGMIIAGGETGQASYEHYRYMDYACALDKAIHQMIPEDRVEETLEAHSIRNIRARLQNRQDFYLTSETKTGRWMHWHFSYTDEKRDTVLIMRSDITERMIRERQQAAELRDALKNAQSANAAKSDFLSRMSHDIRTPLNGIIGMTHMAGEQKNPPKTADCLRKIDQSSRFLLGLINDVLDMSRVESNRIDLHPEAYTIGEFNNYLDAVIRPLCQEKGQHLVIDEEGAVQDRVPLADKLRTNQIIFNLLSNAVKFTPEGGTIHYTIVGRELPGGRVAIDHTIADTGIGMSPGFMKHLFEPFVQEERNDNSRTRGSGLGLAIVKKLVDLMGGTIRAESEVGRGTTFYLHLAFDAVPLSSVTAAENSVTDPAASRKEYCDRLKGRHVLLCEDHPLNQEIARELLTELGMIVEIADNGQIGMERFSRSGVGFYDLILMDIRMPVMDGYEATRKIRSMDRADAKTVPIIAMTADAFSDDVKKCLDAGMNAHIAKPVDADHLAATLASQITEL